ncbi:response regulator [Novosphingobium sp.]|uniref:response regulator n=1 Tax=Novosphingobium sp. TaxID=1874826 RepID=UPI0031D14027
MTVRDDTMHALIIEDSVLISMMVEDHLRELGFTSIAIADRESTAIASASRQPPDFIAADDSLVEGSGIDAVREICSKRTIPTVFMLGDPEKAPEKHAAPHGYVVAKPFLFDTFKEAVDGAFARVERSNG